MTALRDTLVACSGATACPTASRRGSSPRSGCSRRHAPADGAHVVVTSWGLWVPDGDAARRVSWHLVSKATWKNGALAVVEAVEVEEIASGDGPVLVLLADRPARRFRLADPGRVPEAVHARVEGSIRSRHRRDLPGGGAWFVQRKVPGRDGTVLQVRPDPGTDPAVVAQVAADVVRSLGR